MIESRNFLKETQKVLTVYKHSLDDFDMYTSLKDA